VLERVQTEVGQVGDRLTGGVDAEDATRLAGALTRVEGLAGFHHDSLARASPRFTLPPATFSTSDRKAQQEISGRVTNVAFGNVWPTGPVPVTFLLGDPRTDNRIWRKPT
jgi:hypothetical protein